MSEIIIPTDSILRRHFEQNAAAQGLPAIPEDSILQRHYLQALSAGKTATAAAPVTRQAPAAPTQTARPAATSTTATAKPQGWFSRLVGQLFGR